MVEKGTSDGRYGSTGAARPAYYLLSGDNAAPLQTEMAEE